MKAYHLAIATAAAGLLLAASGPASATPLAAASSGPVGIDRFDGQVEPVHYRRRAVRRYHRPHYGYRRYHSGPIISFGLSPYYSPYYSRTYRHYPYRYGYSAYPYSYGFAPTFSFGFGFR